VEANVHVRGRDIHAEAVDADMYAAIDALSDKLDRQVVKHKELLKDHRCDNAAITRAGAESGAEGGGSV
jgi:putative sigma-54 modulation protein